MEVFKTCTMPQFSWCLPKSSNEILSAQANSQSPIYWHDGVSWLMSDDISSNIEKIDTVGTSWLPKDWEAEDAEFIGWNMWGQPVVLRPSTKTRFIRRSPRGWVEQTEQDKYSADALYLSTEQDWKATIISWKQLNLFESADACLNWIAKSKYCFKNIPQIGLISEIFQKSNVNPEQTDIPRQLPYTPLSLAPHAAFVPSGLAEATKNALQEWANQNPGVSIDEFVSRETPILKNVLSGEQVDAVGLAISSIKKSDPFLLGDQTGLGKGRVLASLAIWAKKQGYIPVFFTERPALFHDFWRDMEDVSGETNPFLNAFTLHQSVKLTWPDGKPWKNPHTSKARSEFISTGKLPKESDIVLTTYSQFNRNDPLKIKFFQNLAPRAIFLFDEAHNATGQSNVREAIKNFRKKSVGCIYSSATFGKDADHVAFYTELLGELPYLSNWEDWLSRPDAEPLRVSVSRQIVNAGRMVRREQDLSGLVYTQRALPEEQYQNVAKRADEFAKFTAGMLGVQTFLSKNFPVDPKHKVDPARLFGGRLYRLNRLMLLMLSLQFTVDTAVELFSKGIKPVLVCETTLEQALSESADESSSVKQTWESFADVLIYELSDLSSGWFTPDQHAQTASFIERREKFETWIQNTFSDLPPSPLDAMRDMLKDRGISLGEVSGRSQHFIKENNVWAPVTIEDSRVANVRAFNAGDLDALIVTRAGCSGISLHASRKFKDQRPRELVEWQTPRNVADRVQFFGRVYRKDQVIPSAVSTQILGLPAERRGHIWQARKMQKLFQFTVGQGKESTFGSLANDYLEHPQADLWGRLWLLAFPHLAALMGLSPDASTRNTPWLDRIFARISLLPLSQQESILAFWDVASTRLLPATHEHTEQKALIKSIHKNGGMTLEGYLHDVPTPPTDSEFNAEQWSYHLKQWKTDSPYLSQLVEKLAIVTPGSTLRWRDVSRRKTVTGRILGIWTPNAPYNSFWRAASIQVWSPELEETIWVSLNTLQDDPSFIIDTRTFSLAAATVGHREFHRSQWALCGEPARLLLWKTHHRMGEWTTDDPNRLWLPSFINPESFSELSWPLGQPVWALKYVKYYQDEESLIGFDTRAKPIYLSCSSDGFYTLTWSDGAAIDDGPISSIALRQKYGNPRPLPTGRNALTVQARDAASLVFHLAGRGLYFGVPPDRKNQAILWESQH